MTEVLHLQVVTEEGDSADRFINGKLHHGLDTETLTPIHDDEDVLSAITLNVLKDLVTG